MLLQTHNLAIKLATKTICTDLNFNIEPGQCWAILGSNGSGKTTLLHTLAGLRPATSGQVLLQNQVITELSRRHVAMKLGILLQHLDDAFPTTSLEAVLSGRHPHLGPWQWEAAEDIAIAKYYLSLLGLAGLENRCVTSLSGGERRRLAIAALLCQTPQLYLMDEPTNHLDWKHQIAVLNYFKELTIAESKAVIMVLHDVNLAARYCDHVILLDGSGGGEAGLSADLLTKGRLETLYQHSLHEVAGPHGVLWVAG